MTTSLRFTKHRWYLIGSTYLRLLDYEADPWYDDRELLAVLITDSHYPDDEEPSTPTRHGPYGIEAIDVASFAKVSVEMAHGVLLDWGQQLDELRARLDEVVVATLGAKDAPPVLYHLPALRNRARHSSPEGEEVVRFDELVAIDRSTGRLSVVALTAR